MSAGERTPENAVRLTRLDRVAVVTLSNPPAGYMDDATEAGLALALDAIEADAGIGAVVVESADVGVFVRHYDVRVLEERSRKLAARGIAFSTDRIVPEPSLHRSFRRIEMSSRPFVCAINGAAMGGGFELALACDIRVAAEGEYPLGLPEVNLALLPGAGGTQRLTRLIGVSRALDLMLRGRTLTPREAREIGVVAEVAPDARSAALRIARQLAGKSPLALAHIKRLVRSAGVIDPDQALGEERTLFCDLMVRPEALDLMAAMNRGERDITEPGDA
jgi:enoyl-CoA hydratase